VRRATPTTAAAAAATVRCAAAAPPRGRASAMSSFARWSTLFLCRWARRCICAAEGGCACPSPSLAGDARRTRIVFCVGVGVGVDHDQPPTRPLARLSCERAAHSGGTMGTVGILLSALDSLGAERLGVPSTRNAGSEKNDVM
jgi:hypothetical protein